MTDVAQVNAAHKELQGKKGTSKKKVSSYNAEVDAPSGATAE